MDRARAKTALRSLGIFPQARRWYRRIHPGLRRERAEERSFYRQFVEEGDLCFDIGANVGQTTEALMGCKARVIAVEPNPFCIPVLEWETRGYRDATIVEKAIGAAGGFADLHFDGTDSTASLRADWPYRGSETRRVSVTTLDELIAEFGPPKLCKVDVEGYEPEVFRGLSRPIPIIRFEFGRNELSKAMECLARIEEIGGIRAANLTEGTSTTFAREDYTRTADLIEEIRRSDMVGGNIIVKMDV